MRILSLHHAQLTIPKGADAAARAFYCGVLGLQEIPKPAALVARGGFWLSLPPCQVHIGVEDGVERARTKAHLAFEVDDLVAARARLEQAGCVALDGEPIPGLDRFETRDPFGNRLELLARR